jgi:hypothetical protein
VNIFWKTVPPPPPFDNFAQLRRALFFNHQHSLHTPASISGFLARSLTSFLYILEEQDLYLFSLRWQGSPSSGCCDHLKLSVNLHHEMNRRIFTSDGTELPIIFLANGQIGVIARGLATALVGTDGQPHPMLSYQPTPNALVGGAAQNAQSQTPSASLTASNTPLDRYLHRGTLQALTPQNAPGGLWMSSSVNGQQVSLTYWILSIPNPIVTHDAIAAMTEQEVRDRSLNLGIYIYNYHAAGHHTAAYIAAESERRHEHNIHSVIEAHEDYVAYFDSLRVPSSHNSEQAIAASDGNTGGVSAPIGAFAAAGDSLDWNQGDGDVANPPAQLK